MKYLVIEPLKMGGKRIEPDVVIDLSQRAAAPLLLIGTIVTDPKAAADRAAADKAMADKAAAKQAEADRAAAEKAEAQRVAAEKAEADRVAAEVAEAKRLAAEQAEADRVAAEKLADAGGGNSAQQCIEG